MKRLTSKAAKEFKKSQFDDLVRKISHLAASLRILEAQAKEAGIFLCERGANAALWKTLHLMAG